MANAKHKALKSKQYTLSAGELRRERQSREINKRHARGELLSGDRGYGIFKNIKERDAHDKKRGLI